MNLLDEILAHKRAEIEERKQREPLEALRERAVVREERPSFSGALRGSSMGLIAEVKRRSPSAGIIRDPFDPADIARSYQASGAHAVSMLMDQKYFNGGDDQMRSVREATGLPLLYKEFVVDEWQLYHAAALGASAVLLIAAALDDAALAGLVAGCASAGLEALIEVHDDAEMRRSSKLASACLGINNRNLKTFEIDLETTFRLRDQAPESAVLISESGIRTPDDVKRLESAGIDAILVGEHLLKQADPGQAVRELMEDVWASS